MTTSNKDREFMRRALEEARDAAGKGNVPVGCVLARGGEIIASAGNERSSSGDPTAHAEIIALREAGINRSGRVLAGVTAYVTLEPCPMCMSAMMLARIKRLVFGAPDEKLGAAISRWNMPNDTAFGHDIRVTSGVLADECSALLREFFRSLRE